MRDRCRGGRRAESAFRETEADGCGCGGWGSWEYEKKRFQYQSRRDLGRLSLLALVLLRLSLRHCIDTRMGAIDWARGLNRFSS